MPTLKEYIAIVEANQKAIMAKLDKILGESSYVVTPGTNTSTTIPTAPVASNLFVPETNATRWVQSNPTHPEVALVQKIASQPTGEWLGQWNGDIWVAVDNYLKKAGDKLAVFVAYNIPGRDNGNYSSGGLKSKEEYWSWIGAMADAIGSRKAWVVLEPDAIALATDLTPEKRAERFAMISGAVKALKAKPNVKVFLDASMWKSPLIMKELLKQAGLDLVDGFSVNTSGYEWQDKCEAYAKELSALSAKNFIIDTSRNGAGPYKTWAEDNENWCNPPGRKLGLTPRLAPLPKCDAFLWLKRPGESDGTCRGFPPAGTFVPELAIQLAK